MLDASRCFIFTVVMALGVSSAAGQVGNSITGFVFGENRTPLPRVYVELQTDVYSTVSRTQTSGAGMFAFRGLPSGSYVVRVLTSGTNYMEQSRSVSLVPISVVAGRGAVSEQVDFYLRSKTVGNPLASPEVVFAQEVPAAALENYQSGIRELDEKKNEAAGYEKLKLALEAFPNYYLALDRLGNEYLTKGYYEASYVLFTKAVEVNPRSVSSNLGLGISEYRLKQVQSSIRHFETVLRLHKENLNAHYWLGISYHATGKLSEAANILQKGAKLSEGKSPEIQWQLARVYKDQNKFKESADALEQYLKLKPDAGNADEVRKAIRTLREKQPASSRWGNGRADETSPVQILGLNSKK